MHLNKQVMSAALKKIIVAKGYEVLKNARLLEALLKDFLGNNKDECRRIIRIMSDTNAAKLIIEGFETPAEIPRIQKLLIREMTGEFGNENAEWQLEMFCEAFGWEQSKKRNKYKNTEGISPRAMLLFFVVNTSASMNGAKIGTLNNAIRNVIPEIQAISNDNADVKIKIAALKFSCGAKWITPSPVDVENFKWRDLAADEPDNIYGGDGWGNYSDFGAACYLLNKKLTRSKDGFMHAATGSFAPTIILFSDSEPTDDYHTELEQLKSNDWFRCAIKFAIPIGDDANVDVLAEFTGHKEAVISVHTLEALSSLICFIPFPDGVFNYIPNYNEDYIADFLTFTSLEEVEDDW